MNCEQIIELYDDWRDRELEHYLESELVTHLESCSTCSLEYEIRDEALGALSQLTGGIPAMSHQLETRLNTIGKRRPIWARAALTAAVFLLGFCFQLVWSPWQGSRSHVDQQLNVLIENNRELRQEISQFTNRLANVDTQVNQVSQVIDSLGGEIQLLRQSGGSQISIIRGSSHTQSEILESLSQQDPEWSSFVEPYLKKNNQEDLELMVSEPLPISSPMNPVINSVTDVLSHRFGSEAIVGEH